MTTSRVLLLVTLQTKAEETAYLTDRLAFHGVDAQVIDLSLNATTVLGGAEKLQAMDTAVARATSAVAGAMCDDINAVLAIGGGTGGEIALRVLRALPITYPKVLLSTLPFDPRIAAADSSIVIVPTLADICGLNATLRELLENAAALTAGLCATRRTSGACVDDTSVGITALGATEGAVASLISALRAQGEETTVFHSNGYGGAAFTRFIQRGAFHALVDLAPHEMTRLHVAGVHVDMPDRFSAGGDLPRVVLPGALNFIGLGEQASLPDRYKSRPQYAHSGFFTHVKLSAPEMARVARELATSLNAHTGPVHVIVPMGGFSHQDRPGGAIEDPELRHVFRDTMQEHLSPDIRITVTQDHICDPAITTAIIDALHDLKPAGAI
ncbi:MAG: Tm-1-like ATP-binding domain-containing protein [Pseudomonadota bacterium]